MSLTSFITGKNHHELRVKFNTVFPRTNFGIKTEILASPLTSNYSVIGQAFDYLLRFNLEYKFKEKIISRGSWVADNSYNIIFKKLDTYASDFIQVGYKKNILKDRLLFLKMIKKEYSQAKKNYKSHLKNGEITDDLLKSCLFLSRLDITSRANMIDANLGNENNSDLIDIRNLFTIINPEHFHVKEYCYINPTFGNGSRLVGGADADLIIDGTLIDLKVTKNLKLEREFFNQALGYYILSLIGGINENKTAKPIKNIGIYFARHAQLWESPLSAFGTEQTYSDFKEWLIDYVKHNN